MSVFTELLFTQGHVVRPADLQQGAGHPSTLPGGVGGHTASSAAVTPSGSLKSCGDQGLRSVQPC